MTVYTGYMGQVWSAIYAALAYYNEQLNAASDPASITALTETMLQSITNGVNAITATDTTAAWEDEFFNLEEIAALPITVDPVSEAVFTARLETYAAAYPALAAIIPQAPFALPPVMSSQQPVIPTFDLLGFYESFSFEASPSGLTASNFGANASGISTAFSNVAQAVSVFQGINLTQAYDIATREAAVTGAAASVVNSFTSGPVANDLSTTNAWNQIVVLPACLILARMLSSAPYTLQAQQSATLRYVMLQTAQQLAQFLLVLRQPTTTQVNKTTLYNNETLMDVAARALGNFEQWTDIAIINGLMPPYVGSIAAPGIAAYGSQLLLPSPGTALSATGALPSYTANFLGTDVYFGPINGNMPPWSGDYQTITGYNNLAWALGRRLQTTLGTLIYHSDYGCRIPPEVGAVQDVTTLSNIAAYGESALASDPRVETVLSATASGMVNIVEFSGVVQPGGFGAKAVTVNQVISPLP